MALRIAADLPLAPRTTLGLGGAARHYAAVNDLDELREALAAASGEPLLVLGGGSNLVVRDGGFPGLVIELADRTVTTRYDGPDHVIVTAAGGAEWDELVAQLVEQRLAGVECLSGIPGRVGATPMQNVGAYGQEVADTIVSVTTYDRAGGELVVWRPAGCRFGYRTSIFRGSDRWIVLAVEFRLARSDHSRPIHYRELARALAIGDGDHAPLATVRDTVIALRRSKGMVVDPSDPDSRSAGSFFTNPIVATARAHQLAAHYPGMPQFATGDPERTKLSAGWLIERAGFAKGTVRGGVGISTKHALALVNRSGTARELLALAREIQQAVLERFVIALEPEPIIVGVE